MADSAPQQPGQSKSAKRRAAKKARDLTGAADSEGEEEVAEIPTPQEAAPKAKAKAKAKAEPKAPEPVAPPAPAPAAEAKAKAKAKAKAEAKPEEPAPAPATPEPKAKAKAKAKAEAKAPEPPAPAPVEQAPEAKKKAKAKKAAEPPAAAQPKASVPAPAPATPEPKAKAKGKAKAEAAPAPAPAPAPPAPPAPAAPAAKAKSQAKAAAAPAPKKEEVEVEKVTKTEIVQPFALDDGSGGWEAAETLNKKAQKRVDKLKQEKDAESFALAARNAAKVPGAVFADQPRIPGMTLATPEPKASQSLSKAAQPATAKEVASGEAKPESNLSTVSIKVPEAKVGAVIGPKGSKIKLIQEKSGGARIDTSGEIFTIVGDPKAVAIAEAAIREIIEKGYTSLAFDDFKEEFVPLHPSVFPDLIGKQGAVIRKIKDELQVEISIPEVPKNASVTKKFRVSVAGANEAVEKAKVVIDNIAKFGHDELTHPGMGHEEIEAEDWTWRYIIGKGGSEMRHIQNNYKVKVNIPRETSATDKVVVMGLVGDVARAKAYIEKLIWTAQQPRGRDNKNDAADPWGEEGAEEDWMKAYMSPYKK